jgi:hypothetical protein
MEQMYCFQLLVPNIYRYFQLISKAIFLFCSNIKSWLSKVYNNFIRFFVS